MKAAEANSSISKERIQIQILNQHPHRRAYSIQRADAPHVNAATMKKLSSIRGQEVKQNPRLDAYKSKLEQKHNLGGLYIGGNSGKPGFEGGSREMSPDARTGDRVSSAGLMDVTLEGGFSRQGPRLPGNVLGARVVVGAEGETPTLISTAVRRSDESGVLGARGGAAKSYAGGRTNKAVGSEGQGQETPGLARGVDDGASRIAVNELLRLN